MKWSNRTWDTFTQEMRSIVIQRLLVVLWSIQHFFFSKFWHEHYVQILLSWINKCIIFWLFYDVTLFLSRFLWRGPVLCWPGRWWWSGLCRVSFCYLFTVVIYLSPWSWHFTRWLMICGSAPLACGFPQASVPGACFIPLSLLCCYVQLCEQWYLIFIEL